MAAYMSGLYPARAEEAAGMTTQPPAQHGGGEVRAPTSTWVGQVQWTTGTSDEDAG